MHTLGRGFATTFSSQNDYSFGAKSLIVYYFLARLRAFEETRTLRLNRLIETDLTSLVPSQNESFRARFCWWM